MPRIPLAQAVPGQRLARPVTNASGVVMMQAGTELTAALIARLGDIGIAAVVVAGDDRGRRSPEDVQQQVATLFAGHEHDSWMMELKAIVIRQALRGGSGA
jgi:hypothetical protein